jgi:protein transport protein SEC31
MGVIAGGLGDGSVQFWDVSSMIESSSNSTYNQNEINYHGCLSVIDGLYEGPVTTLEFNPFKPNLVAVGGQDVLVLDITKDIVQPQIFSPGSPNPHQDHSITSVSWNRKVQHILASASQNGLTVVWDLKINKSIFSFQDSSAILNRKVSLQWNPEIPTQIAVTYDDERVPELQIWDLRNP